MFGRLYRRHQDVHQPGTDTRPVDLGCWRRGLIFLHSVDVGPRRDLSHAC